MQGRAGQGRQKHPKDPLPRHPGFDQVPSLLQTKVTALNGKPAGTQYLPNYLSLSSWYSPSECYLQLQLLSRPLQVRFSGVPFPRQNGAQDVACTRLQGTYTSPSRTNADANAGALIRPARRVFLGMNACNLFVIDIKAMARGLP